VQAAERREARAEVVEREQHAERTDLLEALGGFLAAVHVALGDLELEAVGPRAGRQEAVGDEPGQAAVQVDRCHVDRDGDGMTRAGPGRGGLQRLAQDEADQLVERPRAQVGKEGGRPEQAVLRMAPADERLDAGRGPVGQVDLRLEVQLQLLEGCRHRVCTIDRLQRGRNTADCVFPTPVSTCVRAR